MIPALCSIQLYKINNKNDLINNHYSILILVTLKNKKDV